MSEAIYGNTPPFLGAINGVRNDFDHADVLIYGVPWEGAVTWGDYTGCELGPKVMRLSSARYSGYLPELEHIDVFEHFQLADLGDVDVVPADVGETMNRIQQFSQQVWSKEKFPIALGGDHGITYPIIAGLAKQHPEKKIGILHFDAHYDNMPHHEGQKYARSTPFARLYELDAVENQSLYHIGIHGPRNKPETGRYAQEAGAETITITDIREAGDIRKLAASLHEEASKHVDVLYLSICSDVLDVAFNPGGPVDTNGLTPYELLTMVHECTSRGVVGMDFVEVYPQQDPSDVSSHFASTLVLYALAGLAKHRA
ncbi:agmatinase family protein [Shouchella shacheensis]|uniref:agmatinase family protein n=1 Tax=Shouchella shacheensis TaxID=1649580 RepID=UPI00074011CE|nr:agmatinase family protein [Shouchella shacheensis]